MGDSSESPFTLRKKRVNLRGYYQSLEPSTPNEKQKDKASEDEQESLQHILKTQSLDQLLQTDINLRKGIFFNFNCYNISFNYYFTSY